MWHSGCKILVKLVSWVTWSRRFMKVKSHWVSELLVAQVVFSLWPSLALFCWPPVVWYLSDRTGSVRVQFQQRHPHSVLHLPLPGRFQEQLCGSEVSTQISLRKADVRTRDMPALFYFGGSLLRAAHPPGSIRKRAGAFSRHHKDGGDAADLVTSSFLTSCITSLTPLLKPFLFVCPSIPTLLVSPVISDVEAPSWEKYFETTLEKNVLWHN